MLARSDELAIEAAKLLRDRQGKIPTARKALDAVHEPMRLQAVEWLSAQYEDSEDAKKHLRAALESRYRKVREKAAFELAGKKDAAAFDALARFLKEANDPAGQYAILNALTTLGDKRAADALLDRVENDPGGTAQAEALIRAAAGFHVPATADRLFAMLDRHKDRRDTIRAAILTVSGHDQYVGDSDDQNPQDRAAWMKDQHPRHDAILARLLDRALADGDTDYVAGTLLEPARWSLGPDVEGIFPTLCASPNAELRDAALQAYGWRVRKRGAPPDPLLKALKHKNPVTQFLAAEGLARARRGEGMQVLLSGIEYLEDTGHRSRAVQALGELGDPRSVDKLLALATEDMHLLQQAATEAIGHLKKSPQADAVFRLLEKHAKNQYDLGQKALVGLRYFDTPSGWDIVRAKLNAKGYGWALSRLKATAAEQLGYNDDPATRDLLLKTLRTSTDYQVVPAAYKAARRLWGKESLEPNYNVIQNPSAHNYLDTGEDGGALDPVLKKGDALRIMAAFPHCDPQIQEKLESALLTRPDLPVKEAGDSLTHADEGTVRLASRLLGRVPNPDAGVKDAVGTSLSKWWQTWQDRRAKAGAATSTDDDYDDDDDQPAGDPLSRAGGVVESLLFTAGRVGVPTEVIAGVAKSRPDDPLARGIRLEAVRCLALGKVTPAVLDTLDALAVGPDADVRVLAAEMLARFDPKRAAKRAEQMLSDRPGFNRLAVAGAVTGADVRGAAASAHLQPVALPLFVAEKDVGTLAAVAKDRKAPEAARFGAVEGLGVMASEPAEKVLVEIGTAKDDEKETAEGGVAGAAAVEAGSRPRRGDHPRHAAESAEEGEDR
jgi:ParB family chromosome partitioning protein